MFEVWTKVLEFVGFWFELNWVISDLQGQNQYVEHDVQPLKIKLKRIDP